MPKSGMRKPLSPIEAEEMRNKWNVSEWDKPEQYDYVQSLKGDRLRWEFLRRNSNYQEKYEKYRYVRLHPLLGTYIAPQKRGDELAEEFQFLDTIRRGELLVLTPPTLKNILFTKQDISADKKIREHYGLQLEDLYEMGYIPMVFDPARSPTSQIKTAGNILKQYHEEYSESYPKHVIKGKRNPKEAAKLLRALDAALVGVNNQNIADKIFGINGYENQIASGQERLKSASIYWRVM